MTFQRLVATFRVKVVANHDQVMAVEAELACNWLAACAPGGVAGIDAAWAELQLLDATGADHAVGRCRVATRPIYEADAGRVEQETLADIPTGRAAILVVDRVDLAI